MMTNKYWAQLQQANRSGAHDVPDTQEMPRPAAALVVEKGGRVVLLPIRFVDFYRDDEFRRAP